MKSYSCKICYSRGKIFGGTRKEVRKHIKEEHLLPVHTKDEKGAVEDSLLTKNTLAIEI